MRHRFGYKKLNRTSEHRKALIKNMLNSLIKYEQITTTLPKAKDLRPIVEKMITLGKKGSLHARRQLISKLPKDANIEKVITELSERYRDRRGGYTRIIKKGYRYGDASPMAIIEFIDRNIASKIKKESDPKSKKENEIEVKNDKVLTK